MSRGDMPEDPKGLIREAYLIDGINASQCRTIFLDWALSLPEDVPQQAGIAAVLLAYGQDGHPMDEVLRAGQQAISAPRRRGGWRARSRD